LIDHVVTIGICTRNASATILETLDSIACQDFSHELMEVILIDDGSEDNTLSIVNSYAPKMSMQVKVLSQKWEGMGKSRNVIAKNATGRYIIWVDSDMVLSKEFVREQIEFMEKDKRVGIAKGKYGILPCDSLVATLENMSFVTENFQFEPGTGGSIYRVEALRRIGYFDDSLKHAGEDQDAAFRIKAAGWSLQRTQAIFYERPKMTWKNLWSKYFRWGYGLHDALNKNRRLLVLYKMLPLAGFFSGLKHSSAAYKLTQNKKNFFLPVQFVFKLSAWCFGYTEGHLHSQREDIA
jgi:biofilm PGA synthesis N-glycosyltransferase PgaC